MTFRKKRQNLLRTNRVLQGPIGTYIDQSLVHVVSFKGVYTQLRKMSTSFVMPIRLSVCLSVSFCPAVLMEELASNWTNFHEISYLSIFPKLVGKIQVPIKYHKKNGHVM